MKKLFTFTAVLVLALVLVAALIISISPTPAFAGGRNDHGGHHGIFGGHHGHRVHDYGGHHVDHYVIPWWSWRAPVYEQAPVYLPSPPPPPPAIQREVVREDGSRCVLYGDGVTQAYQWVCGPPPVR